MCFTFKNALDEAELFTAPNHPRSYSKIIVFGINSCGISRIEASNGNCAYAAEVFGWPFRNKTFLTRCKDNDPGSAALPARKKDTILIEGTFYHYDEQGKYAVEYSGPASGVLQEVDGKALLRVMKKGETTGKREAKLSGAKSFCAHTVIAFRKFGTFAYTVEIINSKCKKYRAVKIGNECAVDYTAEFQSSSYKLKAPPEKMMFDPRKGSGILFGLPHRALHLCTENYRSKEYENYLADVHLHSSDGAAVTNIWRVDKDA